MEFQSKHSSHVRVILALIQAFFDDEFRSDVMSLDQIEMVMLSSDPELGFDSSEHPISVCTSRNIRVACFKNNYCTKSIAGTARSGSLYLV